MQIQRGNVNGWVRRSDCALAGVARTQGWECAVKETSFALICEGKLREKGRAHTNVNVQETAVDDIPVKGDLGTLVEVLVETVLSLWLHFDLETRRSVRART